jgi:hypothetical protein
MTIRYALFLCAACELPPGSFTSETSDRLITTEEDEIVPRVHLVVSEPVLP